MDLTYGTKFAVISEIFWVWSEFDGKHRGCRFWSVEARKSERDVKNLIHEHVVPRKAMLSHFDLSQVPKKPVSEMEVRSVLDRFCIGCVITKEEDARLNSQRLNSAMPDEWDHVDIWARYDLAGIVVDGRP